MPCNLQNQPPQDAADTCEVRLKPRSGVALTHASVFSLILCWRRCSHVKRLSYISFPNKHGVASIQIVNNNVIHNFIKQYLSLALLVSSCLSVEDRMQLFEYRLTQLTLQKKTFQNHENCYTYAIGYLTYVVIILTVLTVIHCSFEHDISMCLITRVYYNTEFSPAFSSPAFSTR